MSNDYRHGTGYKYEYLKVSRGDWNTKQDEPVDFNKLMAMIGAGCAQRMASSLESIAASQAKIASSQERVAKVFERIEKRTQEQS